MRDRSKEKTTEVLRHAAVIGKRRRDAVDARKVRDRAPKEDFSQAAARIVREATENK